MRAGFPTMATCRACHVNMAERAIPSRRVWRLADFVIFSHQRHTPKAGCAVCHGDVWAADALSPSRPLNMKGCVACHKDRGATETCTACHELSQ